MFPCESQQSGNDAFEFKVEIQICFQKGNKFQRFCYRFIMKGRICLITGANSGLCYAAALGPARMKAGAQAIPVLLGFTID